MNRRIKTIALALTAATFASMNTASAGGRGGIAGVVIGIARNHVSASRTPIRGNYSHNQSSNYPTQHTAPPVVRHQPAYTQPVYSPTHSQPTHSQPTYSQPTYSQPVQPQVVYSQPSMPSMPSTISAMPARTAAPTVVQTGVSTVPQNTMPTRSSQQLIAQPQTSAPTNSDVNSSTELTALQMLASISGGDAPMDADAMQIPEFTAAAMPAINDHVGTWTVSLPGNQSLTLVLDHDNTFSWTAVKDGTSSSFEGQYRIEDGRLTLVRSNDLQQMSGSWSGEGANYTFKLDGATNSGLGFLRN